MLWVQMWERPVAGMKDFIRREKGAVNALREDAIGATRRKEAKDTGPDLRCTVSEYLSERGVMINVMCFSAMAVNGKNLVMYSRNSFQRDTALGAWK